MNWLASIGIAYGMTLLVVFPARTMRYPAWFWGTFAINYIVSLVGLFFIQLPRDTLVQLGVTGAMIGIILTLIHMKFMQHEKRLGEK